jgi:hypothetical protein
MHSRQIFRQNFPFAIWARSGVISVAGMSSSAIWEVMWVVVRYLRCDLGGDVGRGQVSEVRFKGPRCGCSYYARPQSGGMYLKSEFGSRDLEVCLKTLIFRGLFFHFWVVFCLFWSISSHFWGRFSTFRLFFKFQIRYTRAEDGTLMYSSSQTQFKAPQLGPRAYRIFRFCPACGFASKPLVSLGPMRINGADEYCRHCSPYSYSLNRSRGCALPYPGND